MGPQITKPFTTKSPEDGENSFCVFGVNSMQGWRCNMEDTHISNAQFDTSAALFAVFDGHGGPEVAKFCSKYFGAELKKIPEYKAGNYESALKKCFLLMDEIIQTPEGERLLKLYSEKSTSESYVGCTASVALIKDKKIYIANAGDCRSLLYKAGKTTRL